MSRRLVLRLGAVAAAAMALVVVTPVAASAHPLGNFTVNRYSGVVVGTDAVTVDHVLDIAEIPTAQRVPAIDTSGDGRLSRTELATWGAAGCAAAAGDLRLTVDGSPAVLAVTAADARVRPGQAGLPTLRVECDLRAPLSLTGTTALSLVDDAADEEIGWREVTARGDGTTLVGSDVPVGSRSARLTSYPQDLLASPLDVRSVSLTATPGGPRLTAAADDSATAFSRGGDRLTRAFEGLLERTRGNPWLGLVAVLGAVLLGAAHAVAPGHGKTIMAFYLSGRRDGALRAAATVGATVTATHTAGVLALGLLVSAGTAFVPARVYPWLSVTSGALVVLVGLALLRQAARRSRTHDDGSHSHGLLGRAHTHGPAAADVSAVSAVSEVGDLVSAGPRRTVGATALAPAPATAPVRRHHDGDHQHDHDHDHDQDHDHQHPQHHPHPHPLDAGTTTTHPHPHPHRTPEAGSGPTRGGLVAIGLAGGILPSPSALLLFLGAVGLHQAWFGVALVVAFGVGMAVTLAGAGLAVMYLRDRVERRVGASGRRHAQTLLGVSSTLIAAAVVVLGLVVALGGLRATGLLG